MVEIEQFDSSPAMHKDNQGLVPPRTSDPGWAHGIMVNGGRQKIKCKYCHKVMLGGGISRLKQHLAGERGNVAPCDQVPKDVKVQIQQHLGFKVLEKLKRKKALKSNNRSVPNFQCREGDDDDVRIQKAAPTLGSRKRKGKEVDDGISSQIKRPQKRSSPSATPSISQPLLQSFPSQDIMDQADMAIAKFMYEAGIPFTAANSHYFQMMADAIAAAGPGYKVPSYHSLRGKLFNRNVHNAVEYSDELRRSWEVTGCSVMVDRWTAKTGRTVINIFVYCPKGTLFLKSVDASDFSRCSASLLEFFDGVVQEVGLKNIVMFMTDSTPSFKAARKLLMDKYKTFFCSTCGAHCIDLVLEEIGNMDDVRVALEKAKRITQFCYNNAWLLNLIRKRTGGRDIVQLATTKFASIFLTLQNIVSLKDQLHQIFTGAAWMQSIFSKQRAGVEVAETIVDQVFWSLCDQIVKVTRPLLSVLQLLDCDEKPSVGYIYDAMEMAKKSIIVSLNNKESEYIHYLEVIDGIWQREFHSPIYAAAYYLNPSIFYSPTFSTNKVIQKGLLDCIETLEPNLAAQVAITSNINSYEEALGDFGRPVALRSRESLSPATWWSLYAADYPDLQRLAVRILGQTCSIIRCDRNLSIFEQTRSKKRNRLEHQRLNDLLFVHYNLHLQQRRSESSKAGYTKGSLDPICLEAIHADMVDWLDDPGVMDSEDLSWMDVSFPGERNLPSNTIKNIEYSFDTMDDRDSDDTRGTDGTVDL